ncbi:universal stress protein [Streptomyces sp. NPDC017991]|uniref:universal stress protein n=1 Tax=Streptomyces sp. NPDC017991 TaxID=3365026 RepID=UPI0037B87098
MPPGRPWATRPYEGAARYRARAFRHPVPSSAALFAEGVREANPARRGEHCGFPEVSVTATVREGRAATELVRASAGACLVVVGRRTQEGRFGAHLGPVAHAVLHHVRCPVVVVPHA